MDTGNKSEGYILYWKERHLDWFGVNCKSC